MRCIKEFKEFIESGVIKKSSVDKSRARFLIESSNNSYNFLQNMIHEFKIDDTTANSFITSCYDIIMQLINF